MYFSPPPNLIFLTSKKTIHNARVSFRVKTTEYVFVLVWYKLLPRLKKQALHINNMHNECKCKEQKQDERETEKIIVHRKGHWKLVTFTPLCVTIKWNWIQLKKSVDFVNESIRTSQPLSCLCSINILWHLTEHRSRQSTPAKR